jgi:small GTP-binding protein
MNKPASEKAMNKILIMGLDNSGKTSILLSLQKKTNLLSFYSLKPTPGINIVTIEDEKSIYTIWEFGGQEKYRSGYLLDLKKYTQEANKVIYVIDVQDVDRYDQALQYFKSIFELLDDQIELVIFLHKFDPHLEKEENFSYKKISSRLIDKIGQIIPSGFSYGIFKTTIYTIFEQNLLEYVSA